MSDQNQVATKPTYHELVDLLKQVDGLIENLWQAVPWGSTCNLDVMALNEVPMAVKRAILLADKPSHSESSERVAKEPNV